VRASTRTILAACAASLAVLAGCHEPVSVTVYEPGQYKGAADPLLKMHATAEHKETLKARFATGQADR